MTTARTGSLTKHHPVRRLPADVGSSVCLRQRELPDGRLRPATGRLAGRRSRLRLIVRPPAGRFGPAYVSRVHERQIQNLSAYEYRDGEQWVADDPSAAVPVFAGKQQGPLGDLISLANNLLGLFGIPVIIPNGDVSEMSVQYNEYLDQYVVLYTDGSANVVMRTAPRPEGPGRSRGPWRHPRNTRVFTRR